MGFSFVEGKKLKVSLFMLIKVSSFGFGVTTPADFYKNESMQISNAALMLCRIVQIGILMNILVYW